MRQELDEAAIAASQESERLLALDEALTELSQQDAKTADHYWSYAKAWLRQRIADEDA